MKSQTKLEIKFDNPPQTVNKSVAIVVNMTEWRYFVAVNLPDVRVNSVGEFRNLLENGNFEIYFLNVKELIEVEPHQVEEFDIHQTGKKKAHPCDTCSGICTCHSEKVCDRCYILKNRKTEFDRNQKDGKGRITYRPSCIDCRAGIDGVDMSNAEKKRMEVTKPNGIWTCQICDKVYIVDNMRAPPRMDHDHKTGKGRAWICDSCNTGLGRFKDDISILETAKNYLRSFENKDE